MDEQTDFAGAQRLAYSKPVLEDLGSLQELTQAGGPAFGFDSGYVHGSPGANFGVS